MLTTAGLTLATRSAKVSGARPWESAPEHGVYSNQSDVAKKLIGHAPGDIVMGNDYQIESIRRWTD